MTYELDPAIAAAVRKQDALYTRPPETMSPGEVKALFGRPPPADPANDAVAVATRKGRVQATLAVDAHGADVADTLTADPGVVTIDRTFSTDDGIVDPPHRATLDATAQRLKNLDVYTSGGLTELSLRRAG